MKTNFPLIVMADNDIGVSSEIRKDALLPAHSVSAVSTFEGALDAIHRNKTRQTILFVDDKFRDILKLLEYVKKEVRHRVAVFVWGSSPSIETKTLAIKDYKVYAVFDRDALGMQELMLYANRAQKDLLELSQSCEDDMTGLSGFKLFSKIVLTKMKTTRDRGGPEEASSLIFLDGDAYGKINKKYGQLMGDSAIKATANVFEKNIRSSDVLCRDGGDEFLIYLSHTNKADATKIAEKLQEKILACRVGTVGISISVSFGVAEIQREEIGKNPGLALEKLIDGADRDMRRMRKIKKKKLKLKMVA